MTGNNITSSKGQNKDHAKPTKVKHDTRTNSTKPTKGAANKATAANKPTKTPKSHSTVPKSLNNNDKVNHEDKPNNVTQPKRERYRQKKCLVIHSGTFSGFQSEQFSREFDITCYKTHWIKDLAGDSKLKDKIDNLKPECIYLHMGANEMYKGENDKMALVDIEDFVWYLIDMTQSRICLSTVIPTANNNYMNKSINRFNDGIRDLVTEIRKERPDLEEHIFSYFNDSVGWQNKTSHSQEVILSDLGKNIMWKRLKDGLCKALRLPREQLSKHTASPKNRKNE